MTILDIPADNRCNLRVVGTAGHTDAQRYQQWRARRPVPVRPTGAALRYRGTGVLMSRATHRPRPITPVTTVLLALVAAAITVWLGLVAQFGGVTGPAVPTMDELAVVQVQSGETLQHVARRVAPDAPLAEVVQQIRDLNQLDSSAINAGQTLLAPVG